MEHGSARTLHLLNKIEKKLKELIENQYSLQEEPWSLEILNVANPKIVQVIKDSATKAGALHEVNKSEKKTKV